MTAFSAYFQVRFLEDSRRVRHRRRGEPRAHGGAGRGGRGGGVDLWTTCFTPRELRLLSAAAGVEVDDLWSVTPGEYGRLPPDLEHPEFLTILRRP